LTSTLRASPLLCVQDKTQETAKFRVLVVEDEVDTRDAIMAALRWAGFLCTEAPDAARAQYIIKHHRPDLVVLDLGLPDSDGLELLRALRADDALPVVVCSGRGSELDRLEGLDVGADDYVTKPFSPKELALRARAVLRRSNAAPASSVLRFGQVELSVSTREVTVKGAAVSLTAREFDLLAHLARNPRTVFSRQDLLEAVWASADGERSEATVTEHMRRLRLKIGDDPTSPKHLRAVRGVGYKLVP
jgi:two-component system, OmpR family, phosphate regulon response regulator PhoB